MRAAKQEEKSTGTQHPIGHHQGYTRDTEHMGGAVTFPQGTIFHSYAPTTMTATISSETPMPETSQYQYYQQPQSLTNDGGFTHLPFWEEVNGVMGTTQPSSLPPPMAMIDPHHNIRNATAQIFPSASQQTGHMNDHSMNAMLIDMNIGGPNVGYQSHDISPCTPPYGVSAFGDCFVSVE